ncbi:hypothetical protein C8P64_0751 [Christiangramia gaetbulicola]|uniref:CotH protein n=1 Tax=Christiangramia gaetbulicola TaxID=703340 RepID=A0A2T6ALS5_9FLAO|nr:hypothetical protein [Christiangramia gaetbulicola]PTX44769.1 hypothetical protein C8P64_0751 [Christiangramia gaetbulicola]
MDKRTFLLYLIPVFFLSQSYAQDDSNKLSESLSGLFRNEEIMHIALRYSNKDIKKDTNDSTFIYTQLKFEDENLKWDSLEVRLRKRGNFRLKNCYYAPIKVKIKKKEAKETPFEGHKNLKLVMPCLIQRDMNDNIIKEYLAYKLYEIVSPYHFKTKLVQLDFEEVKNKNIKAHEIKGFLVEDDKHVAKRVGGKVMDNKIHPLNHMPLESVRNSFFQFMIGNTDYSNAYHHNTKLIFVEGHIIPVPYDFDMAGMVNTSYATVSQIMNEKLDIEDVRQRMYRGFERDPNIFDEVRMEFLVKKPEIMNELQKCESLFENEKEYATTVKYIEEFFDILIDDKRFQRDIVEMARNEN